MSYYVIIRGPLGVGKTTISAKLARLLEGEYISVDEILDEHGIWYEGRLSEFLRANALVAERARPALREGKPVILDGNFYWKSQISDLRKRLAFPNLVFTLGAPLEVCIRRDARRDAPHGIEAARAVYAKASRIDIGIRVDATQPIERTARAIVSAISANTRELQG